MHKRALGESVPLSSHEDQGVFLVEGLLILHSTTFIMDSRPNHGTEDGTVSEELTLTIESWPRLSAPGRQGASSASSWTTILGPSQVLVLPQFLPLQDTRALLDYLILWMKLEIDHKLDPTLPRPKNVPRPGYAFRDNDRVQMDSPDFARMLWQKCGLVDRWRELWMDPKSGLETTQGHCIVRSLLECLGECEQTPCFGKIFLLFTSSLLLSNHLDVRNQE